ncbi:MAG: aspartyl protease family protein [bacterium]
MLRSAIVTAILLAATAGSNSAALSDPYQILARHFEAMGGLEKMKAQKSSHSMGTIVIEGTGLEGTFEEWSRPPIRSRQNVDLSIIKQATGDDGERAWSIDHNGKLQFHEDERSLGERQIKLLMAEYKHLDPNSSVFEYTLGELDTAQGAWCYVVTMANSINEDIVTQYFDTSTFLVLKAITKTPDGEQHMTPSDYREVDGLLSPFIQTTVMYPTGMVQVVEITGLQLNLEIDESLFSPPVADVEDFHFQAGGKAEDIPFRFIENHIYLPLSVGGRTRLWVLDSGAGATCIEQAFAEELGLKLEGKMKGRGAGNLVDVSWALLPQFEMPGLGFEAQKVVTLDLQELFRKLLGLNVAGILGYDFLSRLVIKIDYANELLSFYHPDSFTYTGHGVILDAPISQDNMFHLPLTVDGEHGGLWNLDLGAGGMDFHYPYAAAHGLLDRPGISRVGHGAGGASTSHAVRFKTIELAGFTIDNPIIAMPVGEGDGAFHSGELTGNIGNTFLRHFVLYLDYKRGQVIVEKGDDFATNFPRDNSGLQVQYTDDEQVQVYHVAEGTPGDKAGFVPDDVILDINGIDVAQLDGLIAIRELLRYEPGTELRFRVKREGEILELKLKLKDLYADL